LLDGRLVPLPDPADPLALAGVTVYVPSRRAARGFAQALTEAAGRAALILPKIAPLGALEDEREGWPRDPQEEDLDPDPAIPPAIGDMARRLRLTRLILAWSAALKGAIVWEDGAPLRREGVPNLVAATPASAFALAGDLAALIDEMIIEGVDWPKIDHLVAADLDRYWEITLRFLDIARETWPAALAERGEIDAAERRARLIARAARALAQGGGGPVVAIGSTGTNAATATLLAAIAASPNGAVVLPGLDRPWTENPKRGGLDDEAWNAIGWNKSAEAGFASGAGHPQATLRRLLDQLGVARGDVAEIAVPDHALRLRALFLSEALRPAELTHRWRDRAKRVSDAEIAQALETVALIEAEDEREEALACAVLLRQALETPGRRAALVTPDRGLARRVRAEMARWDVAIEDTGGEQLLRTSAGALAGLCVEAAAEDHAPAFLAAVLAHRDVRLGFPERGLPQARDDLEIACLRGRPVENALADLARLLRLAREAAQDWRAHPQLRALDEPRWRAVETLAERLAAAFAPLKRLKDDGAAPLPDWIEAHRAALDALTATVEGETARQGRDRAALAQLLAETAEAADPGLMLTCADYAAFALRLLDVEAMTPEPGHPRLAILGALEARLIDVDCVVIGGLDEGVWPTAATTDAFLNRPMRAAAGLSPPERRVGQSAHDFVMAMGVRDVAMTRARRRAGAPTVASRLLQRIEAVAGGKAWAALRARGATALDWARRLDAPRDAADPARLAPIGRPAPRPPVAARPTALSVTSFETLRRDPYAIHADRILDLKPLEGYGLPEDAAAFGTALHAVVAEFARVYPAGPLPDAARARLFDIARAVFAAERADAAFAAQQWPRIEAILDAFLVWERGRRHDLAATLVERRGEIALTLDDATIFTLSATPDRIERGRTGALRVVDFKTGSVPGPGDVAAGLSPQLTLEGAMAARGAFGPDFSAAAKGAAPPPPISGVYVALKPAEAKDRAAEGGKARASFADLAQEHLEQARALLSAYRSPDVGYVSEIAPQYSRVAHLARVQEWSATGGAAPDAGDGEGEGE
jgi:ATP-dependent helicase/nuclease subunit B